MSFEKLTFTKNWENPTDFPTYETDEQQVRADLQLLHNEAKSALNRLIDALRDRQAAADLGFSADGLQASTVLDAIMEVYAAVQDTAAGAIPNGTVTADKLSADLLAVMNGHMDKSGGGFTGPVTAVNGTDSAAQLRNTALVMEDTNPTINGQINWTCG